MATQYWLTKSEPDTYSWETLVLDRSTSWDGVRNFEARNNLRRMKKGDLVLFYHSGESREVVGIAKVLREAYPDPTAKDGDWSCVDLGPVKRLAQPVGLAKMKGDKKLEQVQLLKRPRLSVIPLTSGEFSRLLELGGTTM